jgi:hypothetical protein
LEGELKDKLQWKKAVNKSIIVWERLKMIHEESIEAIKA